MTKVQRYWKMASTQLKATFVNLDKQLLVIRKKNCYFHVIYVFIQKSKVYQGHA